MDKVIENQFNAEQRHKRHRVPEIDSRPHLKAHEDRAARPQNAVYQDKEKRFDLRRFFGGQEGDEHQREAAQRGDIDGNIGNVHVDDLASRAYKSG